jgi:hypothetical protein
MAAGEQLIPERICRAARSDHTSELPVMTMNPGLRRFTFTTHVTSSVGWFGAVIVFLALALVGLMRQHLMGSSLTHH